MTVTGVEWRDPARRDSAYPRKNRHRQAADSSETADDVVEIQGPEAEDTAQGCDAVDSADE